MTKYKDYLEYKDDLAIPFMQPIRRLWGLSMNKIFGGNSSIDQLKTLFSSIKPYGKILINIEYLQKYASKDQTTNGTFFNLPTVS